MKILLIDDLGDTLLLDKAEAQKVVCEDQGVQQFFLPCDCGHIVLNKEEDTDKCKLCKHIEDVMIHAVDKSIERKKYGKV